MIGLSPEQGKYYAQVGKIVRRETSKMLMVPIFAVGQYEDFRYPAVTDSAEVPPRARDNYNTAYIYQLSSSSHGIPLLNPIVIALFIDLKNLKRVHQKKISQHENYSNWYSTR